MNTQEFHQLNLELFKAIPSQEQNMLYTYTYDAYYQTLIKKDALTGKYIGSLSIPLQDLYDVLQAIEKHTGRVDMKVQ